MTPTYYGYSNYPYQQQYPQPIQQPVQQTIPQVQQTQNQILAWVQSEDEGKNFPLGAGQSIFLMNQREPYLYMKSVDQLGKMTFMKKRLVDESEHNENGNMNTKDYVLRDELEELISDRIQKEVEKRMSQITLKPTRKKVVVDEDEE